MPVTVFLVLNNFEEILKILDTLGTVMVLYLRTLPKTVGAVRHKDQNAYRGPSILS